MTGIVTGIPKGKTEKYITCKSCNSSISQTFSNCPSCNAVNTNPTAL